MNYVLVLLYIPASQEHSHCCFRKNKKVSNSHFLPHLYSKTVKLNYIINFSLFHECRSIMGQSCLLLKAKWWSSQFMFELFWLLLCHMCLIWSSQVHHILTSSSMTIFILLIIVLLLSKLLIHYFFSLVLMYK